MSPALKTREALVRRQASMFIACTSEFLVVVLGVNSSQVFAEWKIQHGFVSNQRVADGFQRGKTPNLEVPDESYDTTGLFRARFLGSRESGRSMMTVWVRDTPKSCIIFGDLIPGTAALTIRGLEIEVLCVQGIIE